ncbi:MAG: hypothetical protein GQE15_17560 [Archangiaceae bacterium]|nr:hypothetical protein [Archangiaceae bacterium]
MAVAIIREAASLALHWEHIVYTLARLSAHSLGKPFVADFKALEKRLDAVESGQRNVWRDEVIAQAAVDAVDDTLDDATRELSRQLRFVDGDRSARVKRYFPKPATRFTALGLQSQIEAVASWPQSLKAEPEPVLKKLGSDVAAAISSAKSVLDGRVSAAAARADHRVREVVRFSEDHNRLRLATHAALTSAGVKEGLARDFADRFFRRESRESNEPEVAEPPKPA